MNRRLTEIIAQLKTLWSGMPPTRRWVSVGVAGAVFLGLLVVAFTLTGGGQREVLFSRLHATDAAEVLQHLEEAGIPYTLEQDLLGRAIISVPREHVYRTRIELAAQGIPRQGSVGFEIFDETQLGMTDDVRRINLRRALNGELERTIRAMDVVEDARVQVAIPEQKLFISQQEKPTAAVMLTLRPGFRLSAEQVRAIQRLVGATIEGLNPDDVFVVDNRGNPLSDQLSQLEGASGLSTVEKQILIQQALGNELTRQIRSMLESVFGVGRVEVMATVRLNFESVEEVVKAFEAPNGRSGIVRSEQLFEEFFNGTGQPPTATGGVPGVESNIPGYVGTLPAGESEYSRTESIVNYEINEIQTRRQVPPGAIRSISVGVWIDGNLTDEQELSLANSLAAALGLDPQRGDQVIVDSIPFASVETLATAGPAGETAWGLPQPYALAAAALLAILALLYWRLRRRRAMEPAGVDVLVHDEVTERQPTPEELRRQELRERVVALAREKPEDVAQLLKAWLMED